jgi:hypothetical protein
MNIVYNIFKVVFENVGRAGLEPASSGHEPSMFPVTTPPPL